MSAAHRRSNNVYKRTLTGVVADPPAQRHIHLAGALHLYRAQVSALVKLLDGLVIGTLAGEAESIGH